MAAITGGSVNTPWEIEAASKAGRVVLYGSDGLPLMQNDGDSPASVKGIVSMGMNDGMALASRMDRLGSLAVATHQVLMTESFDGSTINPQRWNSIATGMTALQASVNGLIINNTSNVVVNNGYMLVSTRKFAMSQRQPMQFKFRMKVDDYTNSVAEYGLGDATTFNGAHTTGAFIQYGSDGSVKPMLWFNGTVAAVGESIIGLDRNNFYTVDIFKDDDQVNFTIQDVFTGQIINKQTLRLSSSAQRLFSATALSIFFRVYNTAAVPAIATRMHVSDLYCSVLDVGTSVNMAESFALQQKDLVNHPLTGVQLAQFANSAAPANAALSNTAAGYTSFGGKFQFAAVAGANTDYALFSFLVPAPQTFVIKSIDIETWVTGAAVATSATLLEWFVVENSTAISLATANNRVGLGAQDFQVGAAIGARAQRLSKVYSGGLITSPGRYFTIGLRIPIATATASQIFAGQVNIEGIPV